MSKKSYIIVKYWAVEDASPYNLAIFRERLCRGRRPRRPQISFSTDSTYTDIITEKRTDKTKPPLQTVSCRKGVSFYKIVNYLAALSFLAS